MSRNFNVAVVGYGLAGKVFHAPLIKWTEGLTVSCIVTRSPEKQAQAREDFPDAKIVASFDDLLKNPSETDLAVIATPNTEHAPQALAAMQAGISVVIDKPIAISSAECRKLIDCMKKSKTQLSVFQNRRWDNDFLTIKQLIAEKKLGQVLRYESRFERYRPVPRTDAWREKLGSDEGGGILFDLGSHLIDQAVQLFGKPEQIYAEMISRRDGVKSDDDSFVALTFPQGVRAHLWMSALSASQGHRFRVLGTEGAFEKYGIDPQEESLRQGRTPSDPEWGIEPEINWGRLTQYDNEGRKVLSTLESLPDTYQCFYEIMRDAMLGKSPVPVAPEDALLTLEIIEAARKSAETKTAVRC